jgi:hypothetical protein
MLTVIFRHDLVDRLLVLLLFIFSCYLECFRRCRGQAPRNAFTHKNFGIYRVKGGSEVSRWQSSAMITVTVRF